MVQGIYHFRSERPQECLKLGDKYTVDGKLIRYLRNFQMDGIRFLYKNFESQQACILNDESGLGKTPMIVAFLSAILPADESKRCLIIAKTSRIENWQFHIDALTKLRVKVMQAEEDIGKENIYLVTWETLRKTPGIAKLVFNCVVLDDRNELTSSRIALNFFLRHFENRISLIVASTDVTLDIKQLHGLMRLSGHLDEKYRKLKVFEEKFSLPTIEDKGILDRELLEAYFQRREKIINYCRDFRFRRYRHQFEDILPLVTPEAYQRSLIEWRENHLSKSSSSSNTSSLRLLSSSSSEKNTEELFQTFFDPNTDRLLDDEVRRITENAEKSIADTEDMSPLIFESDSEEPLTIKCNQMDNAKSARGKTPKAMIQVIKEHEQQTKSEYKQDRRSTTRRSRTGETTSKSAITQKTQNKELIRKPKTKSQSRQKKVGPCQGTRTLRSSDRITRSKSFPTGTELNKAREISRMIEKAEREQMRKRKPRSASPKQTNPIDVVAADNPADSDDDEFPAAERLEYYPDPEPHLEHSNSTGSDYGFNIDLITKAAPPVSESTEIRILSPAEQIIVISSSETDTDSPPKNKDKEQHVNGISPSPDIFENYDEFDLTCSQKAGGASGRGGRQLSFAEFKKANQKSRKSCLDKLEHDFRSQRKKSLPEILNIPSVDVFDSDRIVEINSNRSHKIPSAKYLSSQQQIESTQSDKIGSDAPKDPDMLLKTPKRQNSSSSRSSLSLSKKSPKSQRTTPITPNSLTRWLIRKTPEPGIQSTKRKRLDLWFKD